jgi:exodeoxyribonuclease V alpha subunit
MADPNLKPLVKLNGQVERITYNDPTSGFTVAQVQVAGHGHLITVVGTFMAAPPGTVLQMQGHWNEHPEFGRQFRVVQCQAKMPVSKKGIEKYLGSGLIKGIGPETARRIVRRFGGRTLEIIAQEPARLAEINGIGAKRAATIQLAWDEHKEIRETMLFLQSHGVSTAQALKIFHQYGQRTISVVQQNPYRLARDIFGIGFLTADRMAGQLGLDNDSPLRLRAGVRHVLFQLTNEGHLFYPYEALIDKSQALLKSTRASVASAIADMATDQHLIIEDFIPTGDGSAAPAKAVYLTQFYRCETVSAQRLQLLLKAPLFQRAINTQRAVAWVQKQFQLQLAEGQQQAVAAALSSKVLVITGGPGTGKTTIIRAITRLYEHLRAGILLAAPTGRAAKRMSDATGRTVKTIHRLLEYSPHQSEFQKNIDNPLQGDLLIIDETSMVDAVLMYHLLMAVPVTTTLILVGDINQLPSVGPGNVLQDILASGAVPQVTLTEIFRQARTSHIVLNAHRINAGRLPDMTPIPAEKVSDFYFIEQQDPEKVLATILALASERIPRRFGFDPVDDIQVLTPMYRGVVGADNLNQQLQQRLNPQEAYVSRGEQRFSLHDKVMQIRNNYEKDIFNGDIGRIAQIDPHHKKITIRFDDRRVDYDFEELNEVVLAYAISVHKSQGSEYPAVIIPVTTQHYLLLQRNLIYTAISRAKQLVVLVGTKRAMAMAVKNDKPQRRYTLLAHRLQTPEGSRSCVARGSQ